MATGKRAQPDDLTHIARLSEEPEKLHIFHALRVIEAEFDEAPRLGESRRPAEDKVRLGQEAELAFPPSSIADYVAPQAEKPGRLTNRFFGLFGPQGPLPLHLTEYARDRLRNHRDSSFVGFANMLTHRMMGLFYRAWQAGQPAPNFDRGGKDHVRDKVAALAGQYGDRMVGRDAMPDLAKRHFTGHLALGPKNPEGLVSILSEFFETPVQLQQFVGEWLELEPDDQWELGKGGKLGQTTSIGQRVWTRASKFRLRIGPLSLPDYERLLPGGEPLNRLRAIVRNYVGDTLDWEVNLVLAADEIPRACLGATTRLGQTGWTSQRGAENKQDASDLFLHPDTTI